MKSHWNADEFAEQVLAPRTRSHASDCQECSGELEKFTTAVQAFKYAVHASADRPEFFWAAQRTAVRARMAATRSKPRALRLAIASAVGLVALAIGLLVPSNIPNTQANTAKQVDQDELLMRQVGEALLTDVAQPLQPTNLIATDMNNAMAKSQNTQR